MQGIEVVGLLPCWVKSKTFSEIDTNFFFAWHSLEQVTPVSVYS